LCRQQVQFVALVRYVKNPSLLPAAWLTCFLKGVMFTFPIPNERVGSPG